jgi:hypothetical protein
LITNDLLNFSQSTPLFSTSNRSKVVMSISLALREFTIPCRREIRSLLGFSNKSAKKSRNFRCNAQKLSILPRSCPTCWDTTTAVNAVMPHLPLFLHTCDRGRFQDVFGLYPTWPWGNRRFGRFHWACARGALMRAGLHRGVLWASKLAAIFSLGPGPAAHRLPNAP